MSFLQRVKHVGLMCSLLLGAALLGYAALNAYRSNMVDAVVQYARRSLTGERERYSLRVGDGVSLDSRNKLAEKLREVARHEPFGVDIVVVPTSSSKDALDKVARGELDVAFVHGALGSEGAIYQAAALGTVPLHLLVSDGKRFNPLVNQKDETFWIDVEGSGTHSLATKLLEFARNDSKNVFTPDTRTLEQLRELEKSTPEKLPPVIFLASNLPSPFAEKLIKRSGYSLRDLPMAKALAVRHFGVQEAEIPEFSYGCPTGASDRPVRTLGTRLLLVASRGVQVAKGEKQEAVVRLLSAMYESDFARQANLPRLDEAEMDRSPEFPLSEATRRFRDRHQSVFSGENIQSMEALGSLVLGILALLLFPWKLLGQLLARWRFDSLLGEADRLRREIHAMSGSGAAVPSDDRDHLGRRLRALRSQVARGYADGRLPKREQFDRLSILINDIQDGLAELALDRGPANGPSGLDRSRSLAPPTPR